jgi:acyl-CoA synthetase (AMP-forming)/AMP-acid ligase II
LSDALASPGVEAGPWGGLSDDALAYLQFTSGSTGAQKAVAHTQGAMRAYFAAKLSAGAITSDDVIVSWLPFYHDLGLISGLLTPLVARCSTVLMSPSHWIRDPKILLWAVHDYRGTMTWMPNFAFNHCTRVVRDRELEGIDLSSWKTLVSGGETVWYASLRRFLDRFAPHGLRETALQAGYGMAENVEGVTASRTGTPLTVDWVDRLELQRTRRAVPVEFAADAAIAIVPCGPPLPGTDVRIVSDANTELPERHVGEIAVRGPYCLSGGYYRNPAVTADACRDGWLLTGDLGYVAGGLLHPCGRKNDLIIVGGSNVHPDDIEAVIAETEAVVPGRVVAFGVPDARTGTERIVVVCELREDIDATRRRDLEQEIRTGVVRELDVGVGAIIFAERGWIIKTSSGKLARAANRDKYLNAPRASPA